MIDNLYVSKISKITIKKDSLFYDNYYTKDNRIEGMNDTNYSANKLLFLFMLDYLGVTFNKKKKLLDVGCGGGGFLYYANKRATVFGNEISKVCIKHAKKLCPDSSLKLAPVEKLPFKNEYFDYVTSLGTLEHFADVNLALKEMKRVLKKNGKLLVYVPNIFFIFGVLKVGFFGGWPSHGTQIERFDTMDGWQKIIEDNGFKVIKKSGFNPHFPIIFLDIKRPHAIIGKIGWFLIKRILPKGLAYNFVYVVVKR